MSYLDTFVKQFDHWLFNMDPYYNGLWNNPHYDWVGCHPLPSRGLTYPTWGKGKSSSKCHFWGDMLVSWRVYTPHNHSCVITHVPRSCFNQRGVFPPCIGGFCFFCPSPSVSLEPPELVENSSFYCWKTMGVVFHQPIRKLYPFPQIVVTI